MLGETGNRSTASCHGFAAECMTLFWHRISTFAALVRQAVNYVIGNPSEPNGNVVGNVHTDL
eukprot:m.24224 g.24224  ORF g.24224 m.24224 type:complete len:62 (-) comp13022_c0_seq4:610-795(-)